MIAVSDDGIGMDEATARLAFEPFFSGWPKSATSPPATGLGLSIANGLIHSLGGKITLEGSGGPGTTVEIRLPATGTTPAGTTPTGTTATPDQQGSLLS